MNIYCYGKEYEHACYRNTNYVNPISKKHYPLDFRFFKKKNNTNGLAKSSRK